MTSSIRVQRGITAIASLAFVTLVTVGTASAADLAPIAYTKAPTTPEPTSDIHGFVDVGFSNDYITPRGLLVTNTGLTSQVAVGLSIDVYKNKSGFINTISVYGGVWNDLWSAQNNPTVGSYNEVDWWGGAKIRFAKDWIIDAQYIEFVSPPNNFGTEQHVTAALTYDDTSWGLPVQIKPYVRGWYETSGPSDVTTGRGGGSGYVEFGVTPTYNATKLGWGVILTAPTWVSVGPKTFWTASAATVCGTVGSPCGTSNAGVFSTGLTATVPVTWIPKNFGSWSVRAGFQYYHLLNDYLLQGQVNTGTAANYGAAKRDIVAGLAGFGFNF